MDIVDLGIVISTFTSGRHVAGVDIVDLGIVIGTFTSGRHVAGVDIIDLDIASLRTRVVDPMIGRRLEESAVY